MNTDNKILYKDLTNKIFESAFKVHNTLGCGLLEKLYENALKVELKYNNINVESQKKYNVYYRNKNIGLYYTDLVVNNKVIVEIKTVEKISEIHQAQLLNYLRISKLKVGLIFNFSKPKLQYKRMIL